MFYCQAVPADLAKRTVYRRAEVTAKTDDIRSQPAWRGNQITERRSQPSAAVNRPRLQTEAGRGRLEREHTPPTTSLAHSVILNEVKDLSLEDSLLSLRITARRSA